tara:strand:+ start:776 stop:1363 length:588 start_codon:yes stop_codon:yes gene_type:complete
MEYIKTHYTDLWWALLSFSKANMTIGSRDGGRRLLRIFFDGHEKTFCVKGFLCGKKLLWERLESDEDKEEVEEGKRRKGRGGEGGEAVRAVSDNEENGCTKEERNQEKDQGIGKMEEEEGKEENEKEKRKSQYTHCCSHGYRALNLGLSEEEELLMVITLSFNFLGIAIKLPTFEVVLLAEVLSLVIHTPPSIYV